MILHFILQKRQISDRLNGAISPCLLSLRQTTGPCDHLAVSLAHRLPALRHHRHLLSDDALPWIFKHDSDPSRSEVRAGQYMQIDLIAAATTRANRVRTATQKFE